MNKTREKILEAARRLFNKEGYFNVRMRAIAEEEGISVGNLTYHFKKKPEILLALYQGMTGVFDARLAVAPSAEASLKHMQKEIEHSMKVMLDYRFFWLETLYIIKSEAEISEHFKTVYQQRLKGMTLYLARLVTAGELEAPKKPEDHQLLAQHMISFSNNWILECELSGKSASAESVKEKSQELLAYLSLYLRLS
jgi:AcrR family transcriptional regulator